MFKWLGRKIKAPDIADPELHFTILEIMGLSSYIDSSLSISFTYFDKKGVMQSVYCEFNDVKKFEFFEDKIDEELQCLLSPLSEFVDDSIPAFLVSNNSDYLKAYVENNNLINFDSTESLKHFIIYGNTGGVAHIIAPKTPKLSEL